jgi:hypothetical protein
LKALYTLLLWKPVLIGEERRGTRFKEWSRMIGDPIEGVASLCGQRISFGDMIAEGEGVDEEATGVATLYAILDDQFAGKEFTASSLATLITAPGGSFRNLSATENQDPSDQAPLAERLKAALEDASGTPFSAHVAPAR